MVPYRTVLCRISRGPHSQEPGVRSQEPGVTIIKNLNSYPHINITARALPGSTCSSRRSFWLPSREDPVHLGPGRPDRKSLGASLAPQISPYGSGLGPWSKEINPSTRRSAPETALVGSGTTALLGRLNGVPTQRDLLAPFARVTPSYPTSRRPWHSIEAQRC
jgi:hypothetical protein